MTITVVERWKNPDSTADLNRRIKYLVKKGFVWGGEVTPTGVGLSILVNPFAAYTTDGMHAISDAVETLTVFSNQVNVVVFLAKYNTGGVPPVPVANLQVLEESVYNAHPDKAYMLELCRIDLPPLATTVVASDIDFTQRDAVDQVNRSAFRGITTYSLLPVPISPTNRVGDHYWVTDRSIYFYWNGSAWVPLSASSYNAESAIMNKSVVDAQNARFVDGTGVISGTMPHPDNSFASDLDIELRFPASTSNPEIGFKSFTALVNGHRIETYSNESYLTLDAKPGVGFWYDMIFLEVWREEILVPEDFLYERNPDGSVTYTIDALEDVLEQLQWSATSNNFNVNSIEPYSHGWRVVKWRFGKQQNIPAGSVCLYDAANGVVSGACTNIDGNAFTSQPAGAGTDDRIWRGVSTTSVDGYSWAIPLFVVKRTSAEAFPAPLQEFRDGVRYIFPVYPITDLTHAGREAVDSVRRQEPTPFQIDHYPYNQPSGFLSGLDFPLQSYTSGTVLGVYADQAHVRIRGLEDWIRLPGGYQIPLPASPGVGWARTLVYLKMNITLFANGVGSATNQQFVSNLHRPYIPSNTGGPVRGQGWKRGYVTFEYVAEDLGSTDILDEQDAMLAAGWIRGDDTMALKNAQYEDGGLWSKPITFDYDDRIHPYEVEWAIPVCLIHRRNQGAWNFNTNPNGSLGRPDGRVNHYWIFPDDLVDLRHMVDATQADLEVMAKSSIDLLLKGQLRTRLANKYKGAGTAGVVAGSRILQSDSIGAVTGAYALTTPDGVRGIWSDAKEFFPVAISFNLKSSSSGPLYDYSYNGGTQVGTLKIRAPGFVAGPSPAPGHAYATIVRRLAPIIYANLDTDWLSFYGPPCWTNASHSVLDGAWYIYYNASNFPVTGQIPFRWYLYPTNGSYSGRGQSFEVTEVNELGKAIEMTAYVDCTAIPPTGTVQLACLSYWVHYDRGYVGDFVSNYGLAEIPDVVHSVTLDPGLPSEEPVHVGPIYGSVRKTILSGSSSVTVTAAEARDAAGLTGFPSLCWIDCQQIVYTPDPTGVGKNVSSMVMASDRSFITITWSTPFAVDTTVDLLTYVYTDDMSKWVEVGRGGKSVQALFEYKESPEIDLGGSPSNYTMGWSLGSSLIRAPSINCNQSIAPFIWSRPVSGLGNWTAAFDPLPVKKLGFENSNLVRLLMNGTAERYVLVIAPVLTALTSAQKLLIHYTYTPYQGLSSSGGTPATVGTALPKMKSLLHGMVLANTDYYVTQSGPCSYFSGVDVLTGHTPAFSMNYGNPFVSFNTEMVPTFMEYNASSLVGALPEAGSHLMSGGNVDIGSLNAASVLRLPFPVNPSMAYSYIDYPVGCQDFDLDPGRLGAASGYGAYAPAYSPDSSYDQYHQFVNTLTRLALPCNHNFYTSLGDVQTAAALFRPTSTNDAVYQDSLPIWTYSLGNDVKLDIPFRCIGNNFVKRAMVQAELDGWLQVSAGSKCRLLYSTWDYSPGDLQFIDWARSNASSSQIDMGLGVSPHPMAIVLYPGWAMQPSLAVDYNQELLFSLRTWSDSSSGVIASASAVIEGGGRTAQTSVVADLVIHPFSSSSYYGMYYSRINQSGALGSTPHRTSGPTSLVGRMLEYPPTWTGDDALAADSMFAASNNGFGHGRGLYIGNTTQRFNAPALVPGTGTPLLELIAYLGIQFVDGYAAPPELPYAPPGPIFEENYAMFYPRDRGGPLAYCFYGMVINPKSNAYKNQAVLQIAGGPTGGPALNSPTTTVHDYSVFDQNDLHGTAIDAFWLKGRPIVKSQK